MKTIPKPPAAYESILSRYPKIGQAWELLALAGQEGPLHEQTVRRVKLAIAVGALREKAILASVRKALALGIFRQGIEQVVALAAGTLGLPSTVAVFKDLWERQSRAT